MRKRKGAAGEHPQATAFYKQLVQTMREQGLSQEEQANILLNTAVRRQRQNDLDPFS